MNKFDWNMAFKYTCVTIFLLLMFINGSIVHMNYDKLYYDAFKKCVETGGNFIPRDPRDLYSTKPSCIMGNK